MRIQLALTLAGAILLTSAVAAAQPARALHERLIVLDSHLDAPANFSLPGWDIMDRHSVAQDGSQVDYPRMVEGGLDGGFFAVFTPQGPRTPAGDAAARDAALVRTMEIREMVARHGDRFALALKADDAAAIAAQKKRIVFMSLENGQPVEADLSLMATFYALGVRMMGPVHTSNNDLADSATDKPEWRGLSPKGRSFVAEANRLGVVLDASHASDEAFDQMLALSRTPIVLSHSGASALYTHARNIDDARIRALAAKGGVIQVNALGAYIADIPKSPEREAALAALRQEMGAARLRDPAGRQAYMARLRAIDAKYPPKQTTLDVYMQQLLHCLKVAGVDHVGIGLDMDGGGGVEGLEDAADYWRISERLLAAGYTAADLEKIWSGNLLRLLRAAEAARAADEIRSRPGD